MGVGMGIGMGMGMWMWIDVRDDFNQSAVAFAARLIAA
jgi:hypothetical protein